MKEFEIATFNPLIARQELEAFRGFLEKEVLDEQTDVLPFFRKHITLSCMIGTVANLGYFNKYDYAYEFPIHGDFRCDLVVGDEKQNQYLLIEFEDAKRDSIFYKKKNKVTTVWAERFEEGYSQIIDWFWRIGIMSSTELKIFFDTCTDNVEYHGLLVIGRDDFLSPTEKERFNWRRKKTTIDTKFIKCVTYDELFKMLEGYVVSLELVASSREIEE